jgi:flagellar FliJ protein
MRRFRFKLERILELRQFRETNAEAVLGAKAGACSLLEQQLQDNAVATHRVGMERFRAGGSLADFQAAENFGLRLHTEREKLLKALAAAELEREQARLEYIEAVKARELLDKLREREENQWYKAAQKEEIAVLDDLGAQARQRMRKELEIKRG